MLPHRLFALGALALAATATQAGDALNPRLEAARTHGVAPLAVFFDASGSEAPGLGERAFHELDYRWSFGDAGGPAWATGARPGHDSRNAATGPLAGHVYERPGTYTATLTVHRGGQSASRRVDIVVEDPDAVFAGERSVCIAAGSGDFAGCPAGARQVVSADHAQALKAHLAPGRRLLFRRGDSFRSAVPAALDADGPGIVGAFGPADAPRPVLQNTAGGATFMLSGARTPGLADWRVMDLELLGNGSPGANGVQLAGGFDQLTLLRLKTRGQRLALIGEALGLDQWNKGGGARHHVWDQLAFVDSEVGEPARGGKSLAAYVYGERLFLAGNRFDLGGTAAEDMSHVLRFPYLAKAVIAHNDVLRPGPGAHHVKLHAPPWGSQGAAPQGLGRGHTRWVVISGNLFGGGNNPWMVTAGPQNSSSDERVRDVLIENNRYEAGPGTQIAEVLWASEVTTRNNRYDLSTGAPYRAAIQVARRGIEPPPAGFHIEDNRILSRAALPAGRLAGILLAPEAADIIARGNIVEAPKAAAPALFKNDCGPCLMQADAGR